MHTLSITDDGLMGSNDSTHVRSFSRYEYYLLEQAMNGQNWIQPLSRKKDTELKPLIIPGKGKYIRVYPWNITLLRNTLVMHEGKTGGNKERYTIRRRKAFTTLLFH